MTTSANAAFPISAGRMSGGPVSGGTDTLEGRPRTGGPTALSRWSLDFPACPKCDDTPCGPTASQHVSDKLVRYEWACEACGHEFVSRVEFQVMPPAEMARLHA